MKKLNNKGFTVVELTLSFLFVFTLAFSMYQLLFNYRQRQNEESIKAQLIDYSNQVTLAIQNDITDKTLKNIEYCTLGGRVIDRCLLLNFNDNTSKQLAVERDVKMYDGKEYEINYITYGGIIYEAYDAILLEYRPNYMLYNTYDSDNLEDKNVKVYKISIPIYHAELDGNYGIDIVAVGYDYDNTDGTSDGGSITPPTDLTTAEGRIYNGYTTSTNYITNRNVNNQTIVARVKFNSISSYQYIVGNTNLGGSSLTIGKDNKPCYNVYVGNDSTFTSEKKSVCSSSTLSSGTFYTITGVFDQTGSKMVIYVNGTSVGTLALSSGSYIAPSSLPYTVGGNPGNATSLAYLDGTTSNILIYENAIDATTINNCLTNTSADASCVASKDSSAVNKVNEKHSS